MFTDGYLLVYYKVENCGADTYFDIKTWLTTNSGNNISASLIRLNCRGNIKKILANSPHLGLSSLPKTILPTHVVSEYNAKPFKDTKIWVKIRPKTADIDANQSKNVLLKGSDVKKTSHFIPEHIRKHPNRAGGCTNMSFIVLLTKKRKLRFDDFFVSK